MDKQSGVLENNKYQVVICAVLFGCDDSLIGLNMGNGIAIERKSLHPIDSLDTIFEMDERGLRRDYVEARINTENFDVPCIYKTYEYMADRQSVEAYHAEICSELLVYLDNQIRSIRLLLEGPVRFKKLAVKIHSKKYMLNKTTVNWSYSAIMPIGEAHGVQTLTKAHYANIINLRNEMKKIKFQIDVEILQQCHLLYDSSFLVTLPESEILLMVALAVLFLKSEKCKKEQVSKRCSVFLFDCEEDRLKCYKNLRNEYQKRSEYIHDRNARRISEEGILFLRDCVRNSLFVLLSAPREKCQLISNLKMKFNVLITCKIVLLDCYVSL